MGALDGVFRIDEDVVDRKGFMNKGPRDVLGLLGVNIDEMRAADDVAAVMAHLSSKLQSALAMVKATAARVPDADAGIGRKIDAAMDALSGLRATGPAAPTATAPPERGFEDDPDPATRGKTFPHRGYRSG